MLFVNHEEQEKYHKIFREILKAIGTSDNSELLKKKSAAKIRLFSIDDLPVGYVFKINSMTIVVRSVVERDNKFYPKISLNHCSYEV